jgi:hypothetical protein
MEERIITSDIEVHHITEKLKTKSFNFRIVQTHDTTTKSSVFHKTKPNPK